MDCGLSFIDCGICQGRDHLQSLAFFLVLLTAGFDACQWVRVWSASSVSWVWLTLVVICFHKHISHMWKRNVSNIVQILWRCFRAMKWMWKQLKAPRPTNDHSVDVLITRPYRLDVGFHPHNPPFHSVLSIEFGTCFCYQTFLRKSPWTSWEWWHLSGYPRLQISWAWESHEIIIIMIIYGPIRYILLSYYNGTIRSIPTGWTQTHGCRLRSLLSFLWPWSFWASPLLGAAVFCVTILHV